MHTGIQKDMELLFFAYSLSKLDNFHKHRTLSDNYLFRNPKLVLDKLSNVSERGISNIGKQKQTCSGR